jgi:ribosomal protein S24E
MFNALLTEVCRLAEVTKEHEARLDKHSEYIADLRFKEEPDPTPSQRDRKEVLIALLTVNQGKMFAKDARQRMGLGEAVFSRLLATMQDKIEIRPFHADRKRHVLILRAAKG